ncbi:MAG: hypothetical protein EZS28_000170 [Streblomastix strix]|uniref:Uncharacterized protein n=1 Tax=Streblomastix strix TaxID=222440 RepID=A0A5J4XAL2_9EUKA|nr:MAG: hypothetical protein EZS28_000170 [Streblomastix strix]
MNLYFDLKEEILFGFDKKTHWPRIASLDRSQKQELVVCVNEGLHSNIDGDQDGEMKQQNSNSAGFIHTEDLPQRLHMSFSDDIIEVHTSLGIGSL